MRKILFIVNPASAGGRTLERWQEVIPKLEAAELDYDVKLTETRDCGIAFAKEAALTQAYDTVVSVGGDGTANEVINGLLQSGLQQDMLPIFTIFPSGTGSDSVRTLGIPKNLEGFVQMLKLNPPQLVDIGVVQFSTVDGMQGRRYFLNACDVGIGATVANAVNEANQADRERTKKGGKAKYFRSIIEQVFKFKAFDATYAAGGKTYEIKKTVIIAICNGMFFGGGVKISPVSKMDDGVLELFATTRVSKPGLIKLVSKVYRGSHIDHAQVLFQREACFQIKLAKPQLLETDGEVQGVVTSAEFSLIPQTLKVLC